MKRLHMNELRELIYRFRKGEGNRPIAFAMNLSKNTVKKYRRFAEQHGFLDATTPLPSINELGSVMAPPSSPKHMRSTVEPYEEQVRLWLKAEVGQQTIWQRLHDNYGYSGSYSSVRRFVARLSPKEPEACCRIETAPGEEAQADFGSSGVQYDSHSGRKRKTWMFVMTLSWSRHQYVEIVFDQSIPTWLGCHERAFAWFGGTVKRVVVDNLKAAVLKAHLHDPVLGEPYRRMAQHYGFTISPNRPATPRHKGKVESGVKYVKRNFLAGQTFVDVQAMNDRVKHWVMEVAGERLHGTTKEAPVARFNRLEREALQSLPSEPFELIAAYRPKVHRDCHVVVNGCHYSVPARLIGQTVDVYVGRRIVEIVHGMELVTTHPRLQEKGQRSTRIEHYPESKRAYLENTPERCRERAQGIGDACGRVVEHLLNDRVQDRIRSVHSILRLNETVGAQRLENACHRALHYQDASYLRIKRILDAYLDQEPLDPIELKVTSLASYRFARETSEFFGQEAPSC
jgi:transposase